MANLNVNKVILGGRLTNDPELKVTPNGINVATFSMAVNRRGAGDKADFFNVQAWRGTAEFVTKYFRKGSSIMIVGTIQNRQWQDQNGQKHFATDIVADEAYFVDAKSEGNQAQNAQPVQQNQDYMANQYQAMGQQVNRPTAPVYEEITDGDDSLPF
jgi:single-strand DNA-binding protein